jgi:AraC-like DNA-binding protein
MVVTKRISEDYYLNTRPFDPVSLLSVKTDDNYYARVLHAETGHYNHPTGKRLKSHSHNVYHLKLVTGGTGRFLVDNELYSTASGKVFLVGPDQSHCFMNASGESTIYSEVSFEFLNSNLKPIDLPFHSLLSSWLNQHCSPVLTFDASGELYDKIQNGIENIIEIDKQGSRDSHLSQINTLATILFALYKEGFRSQSSDQVQPIERACYYLQRNYAQKITLEQLANVAHLTPNYLSRYFKKQYGMTPINYLIKLRIDAACAILETTEDSLKYVSSRVGFADHYYFSRVFKKLKGIPPGAYREKMRTILSPPA